MPQYLATVVTVARVRSGRFCSAGFLYHAVQTADRTYKWTKGEQVSDAHTEGTKVVERKARQYASDNGLPFRVGVRHNDPASVLDLCGDLADAKHFATLPAFLQEHVAEWLASTV